MIRVISSPSISTTGFLTLIFFIPEKLLWRGRMRAAAREGVENYSESRHPFRIQ